ncbi:hypothetical protein Vafri_5459 [Volvox africanus]|uniref:PAS domain-containing protein n=1 Tax=Volvox africanus TaxID=51714 RepID=A0A8J4EYF0_9CHLO|nr:hypothetical protein Vafri_5459 [Volvox africanus]
MSESVSRRSDDVSETESQAADRAILKRRNRNRDGVEGEEDDLLEQRKSLQEGVFSAMYMLSRGKSVDSWRFAMVKIVLEALIPFLILFNPTNGWDITTSNPVWQVVRWTLPRSPVARIWGYDTYIHIFYAIVALVYTAVGCIAALTIAMRKQEHSRSLMRFARFLQLFTDVVFALAYMAVFDYMIFLFNCKYAGHGHHPHAYFTHVECFRTPHLIHMTVGGSTAIVFFCSTALMLVAGCDLNPVARGILASPSAITRLRVLVLKALYVIVMNTLSSVVKAQAVAVLVFAMAITYFNFSRLPFMRYYVNFLWVGGWTAVAYTCAVFCCFSFRRDRDTQHVQHSMAQLVLYGVFPAHAAGMATTAAWFWYRMRPSRKFVHLDSSMKLKKVHKFSSPEDVEVVARAMRHFDADGIILEEVAHVGENTIKCGMATFPNNVELLILYANYLMGVKRDGPAARTQLQLALKGGPSLVQRYQIFSTIENSKRLKDGQEGQLDLQSYVEFKRNYRAVIRVHKAALSAQREFWQLMQRSSVRVSAIEAHLREMDEAADTANQVYRRVLERYPNNGKLLRCYGKFLEDVRNDPMAASRAYTEATRNGGGDGLLSLNLQVTGSEKPEFLTSMDLHEDACVVINAEGTILMVNSCVTALLGYPKTELEGANVSVIMPQPFSGRHPGYLARYIQGGESHILDNVRDVVALHKERHVFPLQICVTKLSGVGTDSIFLGLLRAQLLDSRSARAWVAPNGLILCTDPQFGSLTGILNEKMVGCNIQGFCTDMAAMESLLELCKEAPYDALMSGRITINMSFVHKHLPPVPVEIKVLPGGTDSQRIFILHARRTDGQTDGLMVFDPKGALTFATWDVAAMLGYPLKKFLHMRLEQLLPPPFATMHLKYLRNQGVVIPPTSCRAGRVVHLLSNNGSTVPVRLHISSQDDPTVGQAKHVVQVRKMDPSSMEIFADRRIVLFCKPDGKVLSVDQPTSTLFGFTAEACVGSNLADFIDVFMEWRTKAGTHQLELLLLSLLDREMEMPGTSWRVKVLDPLKTDSLPDIDPRAPPRTSFSYARSACLQTELVDPAEHPDLPVDLTRNLTKIVLWRRDLLTGVIELDPRLVIRRADVNTGLIVGLPPSTLLRTPLHRILDIPHGITWEELMQEKRKSSMKSGAGVVVSVQRAFEGPHPDGGTMKIFVQGVSGRGASRIHITIHPDTAFQGARANIYRALGLEALIRNKSVARASGAWSRVAAAAAAAVDAVDGAEARRDIKTVLEGIGRAEDKGKVRDTAALHTSDGGGGGGGGGGAKTVRSNGPKQTPLGLVGGGAGGSERVRGDREQPGVGPDAAGGGKADEPARGGGLWLGGPEGQAREEAGKTAPAAAEAAEVAAAAMAAVEEEEGPEDGAESSNDDDGSDEHIGEEWPDRERSRYGDESERPASISDADEEGGRGGGGGKWGKIGSRRGDGDDDDDGDPGHLHKTAHNQSEFVAQWVQTLAKQMSSQVLDPAADRDVIPPSRQAARRLSSGVGSVVSASDRRVGEGGAAAAAVGLSAAMTRRLTSDGWHGSTPPLQPLGSRQISGGGGGGSGGASGVVHSRGGGGVNTPLPNNGTYWALAERGATMTRSSRRKPDLALDPVDEERSEWREGSRAPSDEDKGGAADDGNGAAFSGGVSGGGGGGGAATAAKFSEAAAVRELPEDRAVNKNLTDNDGVSSHGDDDDATSQGLGPDAFTDASSAVDVDLSADTRRARLLKRLYKLFSGPHLMAPLLRMRYHTWLLLAVMLIAHVVMYVILISLINRQFSNVREVHRLALAADRCQLATVKVVVAEFCTRPGVEPVSICEVPLTTTLPDLNSALDDLEVYHQSTYLGSAPTPRKIKEPTANYLWTSPTGTFKAYFDTQPSMWVNGTAGVWQVGNRFIATAREILYWGRQLRGRIGHLRAFKFVVANGPWAVFNGYTTSLDYLVNYAWEEVSQVQKALIIILAIEAAGIQLACIVYELVLLRTVERIRTGSLLTSLAIPGAMLRVLVSRPLVIIEDSDDEDGDDDDAAGDGTGAGKGGNTGGGGDGGGGKAGDGSGSYDSDDEDFFQGNTAQSTAAAATGNATRRYRRMSMDMTVPPPGALLPGGTMPFDAGSSTSPYYPSQHAPNRSADSYIHFGPGISSERAAPLDFGNTGGSGAARMLLPGRRFSSVGVRSSRGGRLHVNGKELLPSYRSMFMFMIPLLLWEVALIVMGAVSYMRLEGMQGPLASLNMASHVIYRYTRVRALALFLVSSERGSSDLTFYRGVLRSELANLQSEYDTLMYGGLSITQAGKVFQKPVPASTFESSSFSNNFFRQERCFRWDQSQCYTPDNPYYEVTHHGLDAMLRRIISEMELLAADDDTDATYNGTRYTTMYMVGTKDLYEGLQSSAQLFVDFSIARWDDVVCVCVCVFRVGRGL